MSQKTVERELRRPDSFQAWGYHLIKILNQYQKLIWFTLIPLLVVGAIGYGVYWYRGEQAAKRRAELAKVFGVQADESREIGKKQEAIQKQIEDLRAKNQVPDKDGKIAELSPDVKNQITALEKSLTQLKPDRTKSNAAFKEFYNGHKTSAEGWTAGLTWAGRTLADGKIAEVRPVVDEIVSASSKDKFFQMQSRLLRLSIMEELGEYDAALKEADEVLKVAPEEAKASVLLTKGRVQYFKNDYPEAKKTLEQLVEKHASSPEAQKAKALMSLVAG
jgi:tetratricopeptide (TPR) repeat protein